MERVRGRKRDGCEGSKEGEGEEGGRKRCVNGVHSRHHIHDVLMVYILDITYIIEGFYEGMLFQLSYELVPCTRMPAVPLGDSRFCTLMV